MIFPGHYYAETVFGTDSADSIYGDGGADRIGGQDGDDRLSGGNGDDIVYGGDGDDTVYGGRDDDVLQGNAGHDRLFGGPGVDTLYGGSGIDLLQTGSDGGWMWGGGTPASNDLFRFGGGVVHVMDYDDHYDALALNASQYDSNGDGRVSGADVNVSVSGDNLVLSDGTERIILHGWADGVHADRFFGED